MPNSVGECESCEFGSIRVFTEGSGSEEHQIVTLSLSSGEIIATLLVPNSYIDYGYIALHIIFVSNIPQRGNIEFGNTILDITLYDEFGNSISELPKPMRICLREEKHDGNTCLGFFDETRGRWKCEEDCLERENGNYCGETDHLTNFALLLGGNGGGGADGDPCETLTPNYLFAWLAIAAVALACCCIVLGIIAIEIRYRKKQYDQHKSFNKLSRDFAAANKEI